MKLIGLLLAGFSALSYETSRAENNVLRSITTNPPYKLEGGPLVSIIIPAYNEEHYLPALLAAIPNQTYSNTEVLVVDNMSEDATVELARRAGARVLVNPDYNISLSRNMGAQAAEGDIYVFIDADTIPQQDLIEASVNELEKGNVAVWANSCASDSHIWGLGKVALGMVNLVPRSAYMAVDANAFWFIGGFDETCLPQDNCSEERDFGRRIREVGSCSYLRFKYAATSTRRIRAEGIVHPKLWDERAIREQVRSSGRIFDE